MKCLKPFCTLDAASNQKYCSKDHAPYGNYGLDDDLRSERTQKSSTPVISDPSLASSLCDESPATGGFNTSLIQSNNNEREIPSAPTFSKTKIELEQLNGNAGENSPKPSEKKNQDFGWQEKRKLAKKSTLEIENHMPKTESTEFKTSSTEGDIEKDFPSALSNPLSTLKEVRSQSPNLIDESIMQLRNLMKALPNGSPKIHPVQAIQAACNCAKQISTLLRLKLDIVREVVKSK